MPEIGTVITNTVSDGDGESDLYLTFIFAWNFPEIHPGTPEEKAKREQLQGSAKEAVNHSVQELRELVQKGEIKV